MALRYVSPAGATIGAVEGTLADRLDALLPQTQCTRCGFEACRPYAEAMAGGLASHNRCPPGGEATLVALAGALGLPVMPLDPEVGAWRARRVAVIDADRCIGCTLCIEACPVDAIVGAARYLHAVIEPLCSGCELCLAPCPVDCIDMRSAPEWQRDDADAARERHRARSRRLAKGEHVEQRVRRASEASAAGRMRTIEAALARARARRAKAAAHDG